MCDVFMINAEKGEMTIERTRRIKNKGALFPVGVDDIQTCEQIKQWLQAHCVARDANDETRLKDLEQKVGYDNPGPARRFRTVIIDTVTEIQAFAMYQTLGINSNLALDASLPDQEWSHYNKILNRMEMFCRAFRDIPMHVIFLCQEDFIQDETKKRVYAPMLLGKMAKRIQGYVDVVGNLVMSKGDKGADVWSLILRPVDRHAAKNRAALTESHIEDPTLPKIFDIFGMNERRTSEGNT